MKSGGEVGFALACLLLALAAPAGAATDIRGAAALAAPLENQGVDARSLGMGAALMGLGAEASAQLWNPAGLARLKAGEASLHHHSWVADIFQETLTAALPAGGWGAFGLTANYSGFGSFERRDSLGQLTGSYEARRLGAGLAWARGLGPQWSLGAGLRYTRQDLGDSGYGGIAGDVGVIARPLRGLSLGLSYANLGATDTGASLASGARLAAAWERDLDASASLLLAAGTLLEPGGVSRLQLGAEAGLERRYFMRAGYLHRLADNQLSGLQGLSAGAGLAFGALRLDYAWMPYGELGSSQRVSLSYAFETAAAPTPAEKKAQPKVSKPSKPKPKPRPKRS